MIRLEFLVGALAMVVAASAYPASIAFDESGVMEIDGKKTFVLSFSIPPPPNGKTPDGKDAFTELKEGGTNFFRIAPRRGETQGSDEAMQRLKGWLDEAAEHRMYCWITLGELPAIRPGETGKEQTLRRIVTQFRDHPGLGAWKGYDEPAWVKMPAEPCLRAYEIFKELDPTHPVVIIQAPTSASLPLEPYMAACDITGIDIYPVAYPPWNHSDFPNRELSIVSDMTRWIRKAAGPKKPIWMTLQVAWGGTAAPGKILRFPTFPQQRYMAYAAIINGARGLNYQGPALPSTLNETDAALGWNWTYWRKVQRQLFEELNEKGPLHPALVAPDSKLPITIEGATDVEFCTREVQDDVFILAAKREGEIRKVKFTGLPADIATTGTVVFEEPRKITVTNGQFEDWFGPNEVHVYKLQRQE